MTPEQLSALNSGINSELTEQIAKNKTAIDNIDNGTIINNFREVETELFGKQERLYNAINIKTINNQPLLGAGNIEINSGTGIIENHEQYVRITTLSTGVYKLVYKGPKFIYYNGATSNYFYRIENENEVLIYVTTDGNGYFY